jgi:hypothetical protein
MDVLDQHVAGEIGDRDPRMCCTEITSEYDTRITVEGESRWAPPTG